ncbi:hypothetical protein NPIL_480121 [Nephila pilipes]|uniref:Uncharacterized protein n=1 Tax=Nephila pilipes TaxID=299642 RepID=A0A8X6PZS2_NEPPI|nr:hypothetical protein NPIL_480121 [Nephila pilipes]
MPLNSCSFSHFPIRSSFMKQNALMYCFLNALQERLPGGHFRLGIAPKRAFALKAHRKDTRAALLAPWYSFRAGQVIACCAKFGYLLTAGNDLPVGCADTCESKTPKAHAARAGSCWSRCRNAGWRQYY